MTKIKYTLVQVPLNETNVKKMLSVHSNAGYIIITAFRGDNLTGANRAANSKLAADIKSAGFSFFPVWGGFIEDLGTESQREVKERSFVVTNFPIGKTEPLEDAKALRKLGVKWAKKYGQDSFLYKPSGESMKAYYITKTNAVDSTFTSASPTDAADVYFTNLKKSSRSTSKTQAFTYREGKIYMAKSPKNLAEAYKRMGEHFFGFRK